MSAVRMLSAKENLLEAVLEYLPADRDDYSSTALLFQGKRPAHFIRKALASRRGRACIPPAIFSLENYISYCYREVLKRDEADIAPLDAMSILYELHNAMPDRIGGDGFLRLEAFFPLGLRLLDALEELKLHNVDPAALKASLPLSDYPAGDRLSVFYEEFYKGIDRERLVTYASKALRVSQEIAKIPLESFTMTIVAGFFSFTPVERSVIQHLHEAPDTVFLFQDGPGLKRRLEEGGFAIPADLPPTSLPPVRYIRAQGTHGEVLGLNRLLTAEDEIPPLDEHTVIVLPSADALFPVLEWTLPLVKDGTYNVSLGYPAARTPAFGFLESLLTLIDSHEEGRFFAPDYLRFVLHPFTKNILLAGHPEPTRILFHAIEDYLSTLAGNVYFTLEQLEDNTQVLDSVVQRSGEFAPRLTREAVADHLRTIHNLLIRRPLQARSLGAFALSLRENLTFIDDHSSARLHGLFRRFVTAMMDALDALRTSRIGAYVDPDDHAYGPIVLRWLKQVSVPLPGTPVQGLQVLGLLETRNLQFDHVYVLDVNDDVLPGSPDVDPLLPVAVRRVLKLPLPFERQEAIDHYFTILLAGARTVHLLYQEGAADRRSRFIERMIWEKERALARLNVTDSATRVSLEVSAANRTPKPLPKTKADLEVLSSMKYNATSIDTYLWCQIQFYYAHVLRLRERAVIDPDIDARGIGTILHELMRSLDVRFTGRSVSAQGNRADELHSVLDSVFAGRFGSPLTAPLQLMKSRMEKQMLRYFDWYHTAVVARHQVQLEGLEVPLSGSFHGVQLSGRADRIEVRDGQRFIIDFKKGGNARAYRVDPEGLEPENRETWSVGLRSVQLPLYLLMTAEAPSDIHRIEPAYVMLGSLNVEGFEHPLFPEGVDREHAWTKITSTLMRILDDIRNPAIPFAAPEDLGTVCPSCEFRTLCGTGWVRDGKDR